MSADDEPRPDRSTLKLELDKAGSRNPTSSGPWNGWTGCPENSSAKWPRPRRARFACSAGQELLRLDTDVRGYLMYLEKRPHTLRDQRELVIDRLMALEADEIDIEQVNWVVLMVLFCQPGQESAYAQMEDLVFERAHRRPALDDFEQQPRYRGNRLPRAKTIKKYLERTSRSWASYGHVRDLVPKEGAVDPEHHFAMKYQVVERNQKHVDAISRALKKGHVRCFWPPTPIARARPFHGTCTKLLKAQGELKGKAVQRVVFYEITKNSVREAMASPRELSGRSGECPARRGARLDFLVGFNLSPLLWKKVAPGTVQPAACRVPRCA